MSLSQAVIAGAAVAGVAITLHKKQAEDWSDVKAHTILCMPAGVKGAMALSQAVIAGGAVAGVAVTLHKKHPHDPGRPLMDFDIALMLLPFLLLGVSLGYAYLFQVSSWDAKLLTRIRASCTRH